MSISPSELEEEFDDYSGRIKNILDKYDGEVLFNFNRRISGYDCDLKLVRVEDLFVFIENNPFERIREIYGNYDGAENKYEKRLEIYESKDPKEIFRN
jgi:hypothetical protein